MTAVYPDDRRRSQPPRSDLHVPAGAAHAEPSRPPGRAWGPVSPPRRLSAPEVGLRPLGVPGGHELDAEVWTGPHPVDDVAEGAAGAAHGDEPVPAAHQADARDAPQELARLERVLRLDLLARDVVPVRPSLALVEP